MLVNKTRHEMHEGKIFHARVNPLQMPDIDEPWASVLGASPTIESVLGFASAQGAPADLESLVARYKEISTEPVKLIATPVDARLDDKLIGPLRTAKASYMLGSYVATIALCGVVSEMLALLLWEMCTVTVNGAGMTPETEKALFGSSFERLGQERRIGVLKAYGLIANETAADLELVRDRRRKYLHLWSHDHADSPADAVRCFHAAVRATASVVGQEIDNGKILLTPQMQAYLERNGRFEPLREEAV
jgi:hypothetical protein